MSKTSLKFLLMTALLGWTVTLAQAAEEVDGKNSLNEEQSSSTKTAQHPDKGLDYIAIVGDERIGINYYIGALRKGMRDRFYHGNTPAGELKKFRKEIAEQLVARLLSIQEAKRRGIEPDSVVVKKRLEVADKQFKDDPEWPKAREMVLKQLKEIYQGDSLAELLEKRVRSVSAPNDIELRKYYEKNQDFFTTPEQLHVSIILLKVDPSSPSSVWQQASEEASNILERINKGSEFAEMARIHSGDSSSQEGGDMGYIHSGMLGDIAQQVLNIMEPGEISAPVVLLEGVALFRLEDRVKPVLNSFESVKERAISLYLRDAGKQAWADLTAKLQANTIIKYNDAPWR